MQKLGLTLVIQKEITVVASIKDLQSLNRFLFFSEICCSNYSTDEVYIHVFYTNKMRLRHENPLIKIVNGTLIDLPRPLNFSIW